MDAIHSPTRGSLGTCTKSAHVQTPPSWKNSDFSPFSAECQKRRSYPKAISYGSAGDPDTRFLTSAIRKELCFRVYRERCL